jgi:hypothetical protein
MNPGGPTDYKNMDITLDLVATQELINLGVGIPDQPARVQLFTHMFTTRLHYHNLMGNQEFMGSAEIPPSYYGQVYHILRSFEHRCGHSDASLDYETFTIIFPARILGCAPNRKQPGTHDQSKN